MTTGYCSAVLTKKNGETKQLALFKQNELVNDGIDVIHQYIYQDTTDPGTYGFNWIALSETLLTIDGVASLADTTLPDEIVANGLQRTQAPGTEGALNHSVGTNSSTIEVVFTATDRFTNIQSSALFNGPVGPTMLHHANFSDPSGLMSPGDTLKITWIVNAS